MNVVTWCQQLLYTQVGGDRVNDGPSLKPLVKLSLEPSWTYKCQGSCGWGGGWQSGACSSAVSPIMFWQSTFAALLKRSFLGPCHCTLWVNGLPECTLNNTLALLDFYSQKTFQALGYTGLVSQHCCWWSPGSSLAAFSTPWDTLYHVVQLINLLIIPQYSPVCCQTGYAHPADPASSASWVLQECVNMPGQLIDLYCELFFSQNYYKLRT